MRALRETCWATFEEGEAREERRNVRGGGWEVADAVVVPVVVVVLSLSVSPWKEKKGKLSCHHGPI